MNNRKTPIIRFKGFTDDWEQRKLGEMIKEVTRTDESSEAPVMMITANDGFINQSERYSTDNAGQSLKKYILLQKGELAYNHGASKLRPYGSCFALTTEKNARIPFVYHCFSTDTENPEFLSLVLNGKMVEWQLRKIVSSGARMDGLLNISYEEYTSIPIMMPERGEQSKIANFFVSLDHLITLHQRKLEKLKIVKKAMLENCFPKNGEKVPKFRFSGFTGDWEQRKVGELTNVLSASRVHKEEWAEDGVPFFRSSDVVSAFKGTENEKAFISVELYEQLAKSSGKLEKNDILITGGGSIGIPYIMPDNKPLYSKDADLIWIKHSANFDSIYLYTYFMSEEFREYLASISHTGTIAHYTIEQVKDTPVRLPSIDEQRKLGNFFVSLDHLITLHQRKLEKLTIIKKSFLEKMFV